jgi:putative flippase GtrA
MFSKPVLRQFVHFAAVGLSGTSVQYLCVGLAWYWFGKPATVAGSAVGYVLGSVVNYILNYFLTFSSGKSHFEAATKYFTVLGVGWFLNLGLMTLFVKHLEIYPWFAQVVTTGMILCWNFTGSRLWAFKDHTSK